MSVQNKGDGNEKLIYPLADIYPYDLSVNFLQIIA